MVDAKRGLASLTALRLGMKMDFKTKRQLQPRTINSWCLPKASAHISVFDLAMVVCIVPLCDTYWRRLGTVLWNLSDRPCSLPRLPTIVKPGSNDTTVAPSSKDRRQPNRFRMTRQLQNNRTYGQACHFHHMPCAWCFALPAAGWMNAEHTSQ